MYGTIIIFRILRHTTKNKMNKFCREFYGYESKSNYGRYTYWKKGFLEDFPYIKPLRGVLVVREEDADGLVSFLHDYKAEVYVRRIVLEESDIEKLGLK
jgi:hypothetical protein